MITEIFINGDSYSAHSDGTTPYSNFIEKLVNVPVTNFAMPGSSNDRILRTTLEYCAGLTAEQKPLVIVGFSFITRDETWLEDISKYSNKIKDFVGSKFISNDWIYNKETDPYIMYELISQNINKQVIHFYTKLFMLTQTLQNLKIPYVLFSAADNSDFKNLHWNGVRALNMYQAVTKDQAVLDLHNFNIGNWAKDNQIKTKPTHHLYSDGHERFADFLYSKIVQIYPNLLDH